MALVTSPWRFIVRNEIIKILRKRRFHVIVAILFILVPVFTYAQYTTAQSAIHQLGTHDWRALLQQQIVDEQNRLSSSRMPDTYKQYLKTEIRQQQYYLNHDVNPAAPGAPSFMRSFADETISLFLPMLVTVIAVDLVSSEFADGTIKLLLTKPIKRSRILAGKYIALLLTTSLFVAFTAFTSGAISGVAFGYRGWTLPVFIGFSPDGTAMNTGIHSIAQWQYLFMAYGFTWYVAICIATMAFFISVCMRSSAAGMGVMMAAIISGNLLAQLASSWPSIKYIAFVNLGLTDYLVGKAPPVQGMTLTFSMIVLGAWAIFSLFGAFWLFVRRDVLA